MYLPKECSEKEMRRNSLARVPDGGENKTSTAGLCHVTLKRNLKGNENGGLSRHFGLTIPTLRDL